MSQKQAVITLIEKKGKDRSLLENWRPISLLNVDTKIMTKVLATRIKEVLPSIIHHNQTGYIKDRYIGEIIRSIFDIMDF
ncbi:MAG: reverse transcriptase domain-containing protein, partial [Campylobacterales bacterium]|nr:reverse transcriptase domain-containing protein [Campylobacterales bacterium]